MVLWFRCPTLIWEAMNQPMDWLDKAQAALKKDVPFFVRPAVRRRVESMASEAGLNVVDLEFYLEARAAMAPK